MATGSRVGMTLKRKREQLGITLDRAANDTNVRARLLEIIEQGDFENYPPQGHAVGIITSYARYLELDPRPLLEEFNEEYENYQVSSEIATSAHRTKNGLGRFGERVMGSKSRPSSRDSANSSDRRKRSKNTQGTSDMNRTLEDEHVAENDNRYKTGSVKVIGTRQTGSIRTSGGSSRRGGSYDSYADRSYSSRTQHAPAGLSSGHYGSVRDREWREEHPEDFDTQERSGRLSTGSYARSRQRTGDVGSSSRRSYSRSSASGRLSSAGSLDSYAGYDEVDTPAADVSERTSSTGTSSRRSGSYRSRSSESSSAGKTGSSPNFFGVEVESDSSNAVRTRRRRSTRSRQDSSSGKGSQPRADENIFERLSRILKSIFSERRTRVIAIAATAIVLGIIIAASILISTAGNNDSGLIEVKGGAVNDTTTTDDGNAAHKTITTANGNPVTIKIEVAAGQTSLISITYDGGNPYSGTAVGPFTREFPVTESLSATFGNPDAVTVSENGTPIDIAKNNDGTGSLTINIQAAGSSSSAQISQ